MDKIHADPIVPKMYVTAYQAGIISVIAFFASADIFIELIVSVVTPSEADAVCEPAKSPQAVPISYPIIF